ncbi:2-keto-3-deoxygalactonate kinase [Paracoccus thiocyanatus]|uniref:2-keto-3-deoxygalactonate kinase n=1 Tax=Paracoccus thiocyanatus TaxID=34006 RepID=A0A1N6U5T6_9RHOB|nr:2-dehydro-3-deoxygalactonokinase [Paracoccus thiocyanatus]SIQ60992.1 2-keto-3-deoxygalactonate kinase [Paracoccus thiocyanatus]
MTARLIGIDWGTSSFRAWRMDAAGRVLDSLDTGPGILAAGQEPGGFPGALERAVGPWLGRGVPVIASGMITSRNGWVETPYLPLPLDAAALAGALVRHRARLGDLHFVCGAVDGADGPAPDVMRGEETEIIGHLAAAGHDQAQGLFVLPGTHSKWAQVRNGRLAGFRSVMTGEVFALLRDRSILGRLAVPGPFDAQAFMRGLDAGRAQGPLLARIFAARSLALLERLAPAQIADYLSGLLIGDEVARMAPPPQVPVMIIGRGDLAERYRIALSQAGGAARIAPPGMARQGLWTIARKAGIV